MAKAKAKPAAKKAAAKRGPQKAAAAKKPKKAAGRKATGAGGAPRTPTIAQARRAFGAKRGGNFGAAGTSFNIGGFGGGGGARATVAKTPTGGSK